jgi:hypothetical protein
MKLLFDENLSPKLPTCRTTNLQRTNMKPETEKLLTDLHIDKEVLVDFFVNFSRFEYALKRANIVKRNEHHAEADWKGFGDTIERQFNPNLSEELRGSVQYLREHPPQRQVWKHASLTLDWEDERKKPGDSDLAYLLHLVCQVRNNLFHGGKYTLSAKEDVGRDATLVNACVVLLNECLKLNGNVCFFFNEVS